MGTNHYSQKYRDCRDADNKKEPELRKRNFDARRVSKSILKEILCEIHKVNHMRPGPHNIIKIKKMIPPQKEIFPKTMPEKEPIPEKKPYSMDKIQSSSMTSLIIWNVSKALEIKPCMELKGSMRVAQRRLESEESELSFINEEQPEQQHLICALLAWQRLGHHDTDSLYRFIEHKKKEISCAAKCVPEPNSATMVDQKHTSWKAFVPNLSVDGSFGPHTSGPIVKLPVETKLFMALENKRSQHGCCQPVKKQAPKRPEKETLDKINAACCLDTQCAEKLAAVDKTTSELRNRARKLARREAERVQLLERAEAAWKNLEVGYQKRLAIAEEKEEDIKRQMERLIAERNNFKCTCDPLANGLKSKGDAVEKARGILTALETQICGLASTRLQMSEEAAKGEAALAQELCKVAQYYRDLKFKEDQARRKLELLQNEADSARALTCEAERAMRAELIGLREQKAQLLKGLSQEEKNNEKLKEEHKALRQEKADLLEDLDGCKTICDQKMQGQLDELMKKKENLLEIQEKVLECRCIMPVDEKVQVKRTPSLAAICMCAPEDNLLESCSCTSLRGRILSCLLSDLFAGLQSELTGAGSRLPCQLLKCLDDQHNWDRPSVTKTNLRNFFSKLLSNELDIAIATSIENYHAKWVGESCADQAVMKPTREDDLKEGWQLRAIERRAQVMANQLAEDLFRERSLQVEQRAKDIDTSGPPPCECKPPPCQSSPCCRGSTKSETTAMFPCLMRLNSPFNPATTTNTLAVKRQAGETTPPTFWKQTIQDVTQLKLQIEDLKKDTIKKEDLKLMEENIFKLVTEASGIENEDPSAITRDTSKYYVESTKKDTKISRAVIRHESPKTLDQNKLGGTSRDGSPKTSNQNKIGAIMREESPKSSNQNKLGATRRNESPKTSHEYKLGATRREESPKTLNKKKIGAIRRDKSPKTSNQNKIGATRRGESPKISNQNKSGANRRDESPKTSNQNKLGAARSDESPKISNQNKIEATRRDESPKTSNENNLGATGRDESPKTSNKNKIRANRKDESLKTSNKNKFGATRRKDSKNLLKKGSINDKSTKQSKKQVHGQSYAVNLCLCGPQRNSKSLQNARINNSGRSSWKQRSLKDISPQFSVVRQTKPIKINLPSPGLLETGSITSEPCNSNYQCFHKMPSNTSIDRLLKILGAWKYDLVPREQCIKTIKSKYSKTTIKEAVRILTQNDSKTSLSISTASNKKQVNVSDIYGGSQIKTDEQHRSFLKQPATTESEYMGTVYLDKSHENNCKCLTNIESNKENNQDKYEDGNKNIPFQYINTNICDCKIYQDMQKDHKRSQTEEFYSKPKSSNYINIQKETKQKSDMRNLPQKTELFSSSSEYLIKFLGVTLDDLSNNKKKKRKLKTVDHNVDGLMIPKDKHIECLRKLPKLNNIEQSCSLTKPSILTRERNDNVDGLMIPKDKHIECPRKLPKLSNIEQSCSLMKPSVLTRERNDKSKFNDCTKCECKAKFENFTSLMNNFFDNKLHENTHKDEVIDSQNVQHTGTVESCICCDDMNVDDSRDLEVNAFHLLEDHIKEKFEEFRSFSCKSKCIPPEEEEKLFSTILQRVKQVISDYANKMKCGCPGGLPNKGSWNRAYGLLQEYLKIKIKRVQCLCVLNDRKDVILPEVLEEVCNLIENDFQRLKDICICQNSTETRSKIAHIREHIGEHILPTELPEKDTNISQAKYNDVEVQNFSVVTKFSKQNSNNSMILKENISSQVPPNLGMEAKSCDIMQPQSNKNVRTTETDHITTDSKSNGVMYNTCDCCYNTDKVDIRKFPELFGTKEVFVNLYAEQANNKGVICDIPQIGISQEPSRCLSRGESMIPISKIEMSEIDESKLDAQNRVDNRQTVRAPYVGYTVNCSCDEALGSCFCMKSIVQANNDKIDSLWKGFLVNNKNNQKFPYIMHGARANSDVVVDSHSVSDDVLTHEMSTSALQNNQDDMVLKYSLENVNLIHHAANTVAESMSLETAYSNSDIYPIDWNENTLPVNSERSNAVKLANSIYFPGLLIDDDKNSFISGIVSDPDTQKPCDTCVCDKVPICHVKMLVEHIEKNLVESKCTCDSLLSKVCPVHSNRFL